MKKLKLDLDAVVVESFGVEPERRPRTGTVAAHDDVTEAFTCRGSTCGQSCPGQNTNCVCDPDTYPPTWWEVCNGSGDFTCQGLTGGCECATEHATDCYECTF